MSQIRPRPPTVFVLRSFHQVWMVYRNILFIPLLFQHVPPIPSPPALVVPVPSHAVDVHLTAHPPHVLRAAGPPDQDTCICQELDRGLLGGVTESLAEYRRWDLEFLGFYTKKHPGRSHFWGFHGPSGPARPCPVPYGSTGRSAIGAARRTNSYRCPKVSKSQ